MSLQSPRGEGMQAEITRAQVICQIDRAKARVREFTLQAIQAHSEMEYYEAMDEVEHALRDEETWKQVLPSLGMRGL